MHKTAGVVPQRVDDRRAARRKAQRCALMHLGVSLHDAFEKTLRRVYEREHRRDGIAHRVGGGQTVTAPVEGLHLALQGDAQLPGAARGGNLLRIEILHAARRAHDGIEPGIRLLRDVCEQPAGPLDPGGGIPFSRSSDAPAVLVELPRLAALYSGIETAPDEQRIERERGVPLVEHGRETDAEAAALQFFGYLDPKTDHHATQALDYCLAPGHDLDGFEANEHVPLARAVDDPLAEIERILGQWIFYFGPVGPVHLFGFLGLPRDQRQDGLRAAALQTSGLGAGAAQEQAEAED